MAGLYDDTNVKPGDIHKSHVISINKPGISQDELMNVYADWANDGDASYNQTNRNDNYIAPAVTAELLAESVSTDSRHGYEILDVAAGTGLVAEELRKLGFATMDALDPCEAMLAQAKELSLYRNYFNLFITDQQLPIPRDSYDAITVCAGFVRGHLPCASLNEFVRLVKPGGLVVIVTRTKYIEIIDEYRDGLEPLMRKLEHDGKWQCLVRETFPEYTKGFEGIKWKFKVL